MRAATRVCRALLALALTACGSPAGSPTGHDADGDVLPDGLDCAPHDGAAWREERLFVDADGDGRGAGTADVYCVGEELPTGLSAEGGDCDDADAAAWARWSGYADDDADGSGAGAWLDLCGGAAPPRVLAAASGDCAPGDGARWRELAYLYRDADGDGVTVAREGVACSGELLDAGYRTSASGVDCDDADATRWLAMGGYADADGDGVGAEPRLALCTDGALPPGRVDVAGDCAPGDAAAWATFAYTYRDADGDGRAVAATGTLCVGAPRPPGFLPWYLGAEDCDDASPAVWQLSRAFADADGDGAGAGDGIDLCFGAALPAGYAAGPSDCAPDDAQRWRLAPYAHRDADGDGRTAPEVGVVCSGATLPAGHATVASGDDCDDADRDAWASVVGYADADGDGVGALPPVASCTGGALPAGEVSSSTDCAPADAAAWRLHAYGYLDADGDGHTTPVAAGQLCAGEGLPDPYRAAATGRDCDDGDPSVYRAIVRYADQDGDGVGATPRSIFCVAIDEPAGYSRFGWDVDDADPALDWDGGAEELLLLGAL